MGLDDEIAEMQWVSQRLRAEEIMLRAMNQAFDDIFGSATPATAEVEPDDKSGGLVDEVKRVLNAKP